MPVGSDVSVREFARRDGCDESLVRRAIGKGQLTAFSDGTLDPALIGTGWRKSARRSADIVASASADSPQSVRTPEQVVETADAFANDVLAGRYVPLAEAEKVKENALALKHMLDARKRAAGLVDRQAVLDAAFKRARGDRDAWLNWPSRVGPLIAAELGIEDDRLADILAAHVHQHLVDLGDPELDFEGDDAG